jgi:RNA polymerase sigma-70 factor (ECF subfamily)
MAQPIDRRTVDRLVVEHLPAALRFAMRLTGDAGIAEDVVQESLCRVLRNWQSYRGEAAFRTWMLQIVLNVDRDRRRKDQRMQSMDLTSATVEVAPPPVQAGINELQAAIRVAIDALPERQREVALLSLGEGLSAHDVANVLETTPANVYTCLHLARKHIAQAIGVSYSH